jgi:hypothetical protein
MTLPAPPNSASMRSSGTTSQPTSRTRGLLDALDSIADLRG